MNPDSECFHGSGGRGDDGSRRETDELTFLLASVTSSLLPDRQSGRPQSSGYARGARDTALLEEPD